MGRKSKIARIYEGVSIFAVVQLLGMTGLLGYAFWTGALDEPTLRAIGAALRKELPVAPVKPAPAPVETPQSAPPVASTGSLSDDLEILRRESERTKVELQQQLALVNAITLKTANDRDAVQQEKAQVEAQKENPLQGNRPEGFRRQVGIIEELSPKVAVEHLLAMEDPRDAARVLVTMEPRKAKKIVEAAKSGDQLRQMQAVLARVQDVAPEKSTELQEQQP